MDLLGRFRGCLLGLAVGESLALPVAGLDAGTIATLHGVLSEMVGGPGPNQPAGRTGANTSMMLCVLHSYLEQGCFDPHDIADRLRGWHSTSGVDCDAATHLACNSLQLGYNFERAGRDAWHGLTAGQRLGAGSLARTVPAGLLHYHDDVHLIGEARVISGITHIDETCKLACVCLNLALAHLLMADAHSLLYELVDFIEPRSSVLGTALRAIPNMALAELPATGTVVETLQAALWAALHCTSYEEGLTLIINRGGDSTATAAVAGALLGARFGKPGIPPRWFEAQVDHELIDASARRLFQLCEDA